MQFCYINITINTRFILNINYAHTWNEYLNVFSFRKRYLCVKLIEQIVRKNHNLDIKLRLYFVSTI